MSAKLFSNNDLMGILEEVSNDQATTDLCVMYLNMMAGSLTHATYLLMSCEYTLFNPFNYDAVDAVMTGEMRIFDINNASLRDNMMGTNIGFFNDAFMESVRFLLLDESEEALGEVVYVLSNYITTIMYMVFGVDLRGTPLVLDETVCINTVKDQYLVIGKGVRNNGY